MAETKKPVNVTPAAKALAAQAADTKTETVKAATAASVAATKEEVKKEEPKKTPGRKPGAKKATAKKTAGRKTAAAKKTTAKATTAKAEKPAKAAAKKESLKVTLHLEYKGQSRTTDELVKIAKDVWRYDMKQKVGDFKKVELYVKPEENKVYFVVNGDMTGSFDL